MAPLNACVMIHQPLGGAQGQATDMEIQVREVSRIKKRLNEIEYNLLSINGSTAQ